jgi:hypothetical protein
MQRVAADLAALMALPAGEQRRGPQQAADVLGAKRWRGWRHQSMIPKSGSRFSDKIMLQR